MSEKQADFQILRTTIQAAYSRLNNWRKVAAEFGLTSGLAYRIAVDGYEPKEPHIRTLLGLPAYALAQVCPKCGEVHNITEVCLAQAAVTVYVEGLTPEQHAEATERGEKLVTIIMQKPRPKRKSKPRPRASIHLENPESAAQTIRKKMDPEILAALVALLKEAEHEQR